MRKRYAGERGRGTRDSRGSSSGRAGGVMMYGRCASSSSFEGGRRSSDFKSVMWNAWPVAPSPIPWWYMNATSTPRAASYFSGSMSSTRQIGSCPSLWNGMLCCSERTLSNSCCCSSSEVPESWINVTTSSRSMVFRRAKWGVTVSSSRTVRPSDACVRIAASSAWKRTSRDRR